MVPHIMSKNPTCTQGQVILSFLSQDKEDKEDKEVDQTLQ